MPSPTKHMATPAFQQLQYAFAGHIRNPDQPIPRHIEDRRMRIYRELFFNTVEGFAATAFPVTKSIMPEAWWQQSIRDFMINYRCESPYFHQISEQFLTYITQTRAATDNEPGFLYELMHYEWIELALDIAEDDPFSDIHALNNQLIEHAPQVSPLAWTLNYRYPVHRISPEFQPDIPSEQPVWLLVYRNADDCVKFMELNPVSARLIDLMSHQPLASGYSHLLKIAEEMQMADPTPVLDGGTQLLHQFYKAGIVLGAAKIPKELTL